MPTNANGTYSENAQEVTYVYERSDAALVIVRYEDMEGNQLAEPTILNGKLACLMKATPKKYLAGGFQRRLKMQKVPSVMPSKKLFMFTVLIKRMNREKIQEKIHQNQKTRRRTKRTGIAQEITASKQTHKPNQK